MMTSYDTRVEAKSLPIVDVGKLSISYLLMKSSWICSVEFA